jgi:hypothetical protein
MRVLHVTSEYCCPRANRFSLILGGGSVSRLPHTAFPEAFDSVVWRQDADPKWFAEQITKSDADLIMFHAEMYSGWLAEAVREGAGKRPLVVNVHDLTAARTGYVPDIYEPLLYDVADALMFVMPAQQEFAKAIGYNTDKPTLFVPNYPSSTMFVDRKMLPHIGGVVYEGGLEPRGTAGAWRDLSPVADALAPKGGLHVYPANPGIDYGIQHDMVLDYRILIHQLGRHDWNFTGTMQPNLAWMQTFATKVGDGWAAGVPFLALNTPIMLPWAEEGMGICTDTLDFELPDPKPFRKAVLANRDRYTMEYEAPRIREFLEQL